MGLQDWCEQSPSTLGILGICYIHHVKYLPELMLLLGVYCLCTLTWWFGSPAWRGTRNPKSLHFLTVLVMSALLLFHMIPGHLLTAHFNYFQSEETNVWYDNYIYSRPYAPRGEKEASWPPPPRTSGQHMFVQSIIEILSLVCLMRGHGELGGLLAVADAGNGTCLHLYYYGGTFMERVVDCYPTHSFVTLCSVATALTAPQRGKRKRDMGLRVRHIIQAFLAGALFTVASFVALGRKPVVRGRIGGAAGQGWWPKDMKRSDL